MYTWIHTYVCMYPSTYICMHVYIHTHLWAFSPPPSILPTPLSSLPTPFSSPPRPPPLPSPSCVSVRSVALLRFDKH